MYSDKKNSFWLSIQYVSTILISFLTLKLNLNYFGQELFGLWILLLSLWNFGSTIDLGFGTAVVKFTAEAYHQKDVVRQQKIISIGLLTFSVFGLLIFFTVLLISHLFYLSNEKLVPAEYLESGKAVVLILGANFYFQYLSLFVKSLFEGLQNYVTVSKLSLVHKMLILTSVVVVIYLKLSIVMLSIFYLTSSVVYICIVLIALKHKYPFIKLSISKFDRIEFRKIFNFSSNVQLAGIFGSLIDPLIKYLLGTYSSLNTISLYEIARRIVSSVSGLFFTSFSNVLPKVSVLRGIDEYKGFLSNFGKELMNFGILFSALIFGILGVMISLVIEYWFNAPDAILIFMILALPEAINHVGYTWYIFLMGIGKAGYLSLLQLINLFTVSISMMAGFIIFESNLGIIGYYFSVIIANILMLIFVSRELSQDFRATLKPIRVKKFLLLQSVLLSSVVFVYLFDIDAKIILTIQCVMLIIPFIKDLKFYSNKFINLIPKKS